MKKILGILMTALLLCAAALCFAEDAAYIGTVTGGKLHMRKSPSADGKVIATCASGTQVDVLSVDGEWCKVRLGEKVGYMKTRYLTLEALAPHLGWGKTPADGSILLLYAQPDTSSEIVAQQMSGGVFDLAAKENGFYQVTLGRGQAAYLESGKVTLLSGDFERSFVGGASGERITPAVLGTAEHAFGSARTMSRSSGRFLYEITYPDTGFAAVDTKIENWVNGTLAAFERNHVLHHKEENASLKIHYQAAKLDDRYGSVLLMAEYKTASDTLHALYALNLDLTSGTVLTMNDLFSSQQKPLFCLRAKAEALMPNPSLGYGSQPDSSWLQYAVITRAGLEVYLPAGLYLPSSLGTQKVLLTYRNIGAAMKLDSQRIADAVNWIDPTRPMLALTFDDGPSEETARILAVLDQYDGHATFCVQGYKVESFASTVRRAIAQGNEIASHTWNHKKLTELSSKNVRSQLERTNQAVASVADGYQVKVLRCPYGSVGKTVRNVCADLDMIIASWELDTLDWSTRSTNKTYRAIMKGAKNGCIVLCHDLYGTTASAIEKAVPELVAKGYQLVTVSELLSFHKDGITPGTVYAYLDPDNIDTSK